MTPSDLLAIFGVSLFITGLYHLFYVLGSKKNPTFIKGWVIPIITIFSVIMFADWASHTDVYKMLTTFMEAPLW